MTSEETEKAEPPMTPDELRAIAHSYDQLLRALSRDWAEVESRGGARLRAWADTLDAEETR